MTRRTPTDTPATETPALHGHYDGPRGHQDEHRHLGGDKEHGHPDRQALGRVVGRVEYVHGDNLASARAAIRQEEQKRLEAAEQRIAEQRVAAAHQRLDSLADTPTVEVPAVGAFDPGIDPTVASTAPAALVPAGATANGDRDHAPGFAELARIVEHAETQRFEGTITIELLSVLTEAIRQETRRDLVHPDLVAKGLRLFESWAMRRGLRKIEGAGS